MGHVRVFVDIDPHGLQLLNELLGIRAQTFVILVSFGFLLLLVHLKFEVKDGHIVIVSLHVRRALLVTPLIQLRLRRLEVVRDVLWVIETGKVLHLQTLFSGVKLGALILLPWLIENGH